MGALDPLGGDQAGDTAAPLVQRQRQLFRAAQPGGVRTRRRWPALSGHRGKATRNPRGAWAPKGAAAPNRPSGALFRLALRPLRPPARRGRGRRNSSARRAVIARKARRSAAAVLIAEELASAACVRRLLAR